jgi:hypothetical protein
MNVIRKQREGIYTDMMQAAKTFLPVKEQQGLEEYRKQVVSAITDYAETLKAQKEYITFCQSWNLDADEFIKEILDKAIVSIR